MYATKSRALKLHITRQSRIAPAQGSLDELTFTSGTHVP